MLPRLAAAALWALATLALAADGGMPGDNGRPGGNGMPAAPGSPPPPGGGNRPPRQIVPAIPMALALQAAQAIAEGCKQYPLGVAVVNAAGEPILTYIPDGGEAHHTYTAIRKAYTAWSFQTRTSELMEKVGHDPELAAKIAANPNFIAFKGGIPLRAGGHLIGAIGVSGAEPGEHDEECGLIGLKKIEGQLK